MEGFRKMKGKIYESSHFDIKPNTLTNDSTIRLNWNVFKIHVSKCEKCQNKCLVIWSHIVKEDFEK
jgi:hypothetical protein